MLYFAYGSNMDEARMKAANRCPNARYIFKALLPGFRLAFTRRLNAGSGAADVVEDTSHSVWGVVYDITETDRRQLDAREGVAVNAYRPAEVFIQPFGDSEQRLKVLTYVVCDKHETHQRPTREYLNYLVHGAEHRGLPSDYIKMLKQIETV